MKSVKVPAAMENLDNMINHILSCAEEAGLDKSAKGQIHLACEEALVNVINYAYPDREGHIEILCDASKDGKRLTIRIIDQGIAFDPLQKPDPDRGLPVEEMKIGGFGVYMYKTIMDDVHYERKDGKNILTMEKNI